MKLSVGAAALMTASLLVLACNKKSDDTGSSTKGTAVEQALSEANEKSGGRLFDETLTKKACEILTAERVGQTFSVPAAELKQMRLMGCVYTWEGPDDQPKMQLEARFSTIQVHRNEASAKQWFANATKGMSQEEVKQAMAEVTSQAKEREEIDTKTKEQAVDKVGGALTELTGSDGIRFESIDGVGDEARLSLTDGGVWLRTGNLTFVITAYHGPVQPKPDLTGVGLQGMAKAALAANREWVKQTMPKRKEDAVKLAQVVLKALP